MSVCVCVCVVPFLHLSALVPRAHGLSLNPPRAFFVSAVTYGTFVSLDFSSSWDDSRFRKAVWACNAEKRFILAVWINI